MSQQSEYDAAYFTLLRAREDLDHLTRYTEFLETELARLATFAATIDTGAEDIPRKFRKLVDSTDKVVIEAIGRRRAIVLSERDKMPDRIAAQEAFVAECEAEADALRP
ncbi:hypothetical protein [Euzebya tangerina]|uniref:hypothetical protein n=1 Tax=Euzebya tangerina TaxID=591198 RepID=UPI000E31CFB5|nr:hypothetical protein [Euzebya tangerina]